MAPPVAPSGSRHGSRHSRASRGTIVTIHGDTDGAEAAAVPKTLTRPEHKKKHTKSLILYD